METRNEFIEEVAKLWPAAKGSVRKYNKKCLKKTVCEKCKSGEGHPVWEMTYYQDGKQKSKHIAAAHVAEVKKALENGRKIEDLLVAFGLRHIDELKKK